MTVQTFVARVASPSPGSARMLVDGRAWLDLPWWPNEIEYSQLAPSYAETERPGREVLLTRSNQPLESLRIAFTLRGRTLAESASSWVAAVRALARTKSPVQLVLGGSDRGRWRVVEAGYSETDWAPDGSPAIADVVILLRQAIDASIPVGPIPQKPRKPRRS